MNLPLIIRLMRPAEEGMVLSDWKKDLADARLTPNGPHCALREWEFWALANHVVDKVTFPTAMVYMGCHADEPDVSCCWIAIRPNGESAFDVLHSYARRSIRQDPELAASIERELRKYLQVPFAPVPALNLFKELKR